MRYCRRSRALSPTKVGMKSSLSGNFSWNRSRLLHRCNTFPVIPDETQRRLRSSLVFRIAQAQDQSSEARLRSTTGRGAGNMDELIGRLASSAGIDNAVAEKSVGIILGFLRNEGP